jgi:hypothetical protein
MGFHPVPKPSPTVKPPKGMRKRNAARVADEFKRTYGSKARQKWVNLQACAACGIWGHSVNAHVLGNDGARRKGGYTTIAPLCAVRIGPSGHLYQGCHATFDEHPVEFKRLYPDFSAKKAAAITERNWRKFLNSAVSPEREPSNG